VAELVRQQSERARQDVLSIFPAAQQARQAGFQGAADIFGQVIPQQAEVFQRGITSAQDVLQGGLSAFNNAILGLPQDLSSTGPLGQPAQPFDINLGFAQQQLPQVQTAGQLNIPSGGGTTPIGGINTFGEFGGINQDQLLQQLLASQGQPSANQPTAPPPAAQPIGNFVSDILNNPNFTDVQMGEAILNEANRRNLSIGQLADNSLLTRDQIQQGIDFVGLDLRN